MKVQYRDSNIIIFESALYRTTATVVETPDFLLLVDPNWLPQEIDEIHSYVHAKSHGKKLFLLFTHSDYDHIIGYEAFKGAETIASQKFVKNPEKAKQLQEIFSFDQTYYISRNYPITYPEIDIIICEDRQVIQFDHSRLHFFQAPGHTDDSLFTFVEPEGIFIAGDYLSNIEFPFIYGKSQDYNDSLRKAEEIINTFPVKLLIPGHGDHTVSVNEMRRRIQKSREYLEALRQSVENGSDFPEELITRYEFSKALSAAHRENMDVVRAESKK